MTPRPLVLAALALALGCPSPSGSPPPDDRIAPVAPDGVRAFRIAIEAPAGDLDHARIQAIAERVRGLGDVRLARIQAERHDDGPSSLTLEVAGADLPDAAALRAELRDLPGLADASVDVQPMPADALAPPPLSDDPDASPEAVKRAVLERLHADGVDGDVKVEVVDDDGERNVRVRVLRTADDLEEAG